MQLSQQQFARVAELLHRLAGIALRHGKEDLVAARLGGRMKVLGVGTFDEYLDRVDNDARELDSMVDALTTNKTDFFRELPHFAFLENTLIPAWRSHREPIRIWSAACSTGEEPYSIAMTLCDHNDIGSRARILATDLSARVLAQARAGTYSTLSGVPADRQAKYFRRSNDEWTVGPLLRRIIHFGRVNLLDDWPMRGPFHAIFCRNVMIYFDRPTQLAIVARFHELLAPGGYLMIGHSESLGTSGHSYRYVQPAVYRK